MSRPKAVHTVESLMARTVEIGECRIWQGYITNKTPQVEHEGKMTPVRKVIFQLQGKQLSQGHYFGTSCEVYGCVCPEHIAQRSKSAHLKRMAKKAGQGTVKAERVRKMTQTRRKTWAKLDLESANAIRVSEESGPVLAQKYGITRSLVNKIKRGQQWKDTSNPFAGLMA